MSGGGLWERMTSFESLYSAARRARRGKRRATSTALFEHDLERNLVELHEELRERRYRPAPYREFVVREPTERHIRAAAYRDRVVHHALVWELEPRFERHMVPQSYACRLGKGTHAALDRLQSLLRRGRWVLKVDLRKYFYTIDHALLLADVNRLVPDAQVRALCATIVGTYDAGSDYYFPVPHDDLFALARPRGVPIGNLTSQLFANAFLNPVDNWLVREQGWGRYVRYMDDLVLVGDSRDEMHALRAALEQQLAERRLVVHPIKTQCFPARNGVPFLGFRVYAYYRRLRRQNVRRFTARLRRQQRAVSSGAMPLERVRRSLSAWLGYADPVRHERFLERLLERPNFAASATDTPVRFTARQAPTGR